MCGINGFTGPHDEVLLHAMNEKTAHRGPDGSATFIHQGISMGHNRLAIIDPLTRSDQPMTDVSGRYTIVYNGEIYNFRELKKELEAQYTFQTTSDTEVLLAGYAAWGAALFDKLNGIFALAIWDVDTKQLVLARDGAGVKPLYMARHGNRLVFSSEIQAMFVHDIPRTVNASDVDLYMRILFKPGPETFFSALEQVPPGHVATVKDGAEVSLKRFYTPSYHSYPSPVSYREAILGVRAEVERAVVRQLISDKPLGVFLSGGLDSSIVLALAASQRPALDAFTACYRELGDDAAETRFNADAVLAAQTATRYGARHHLVEIRPSDVAALLERGVQHLGTPVSSATMVAQLAVAAYAKQHVDVVLTGNGGDEVFGGYERYRFAEVARLLDQAPFLRSTFQKMPGIKKFADAPGAARIERFMFQNQSILNHFLANADGVARARHTVETHLNSFPERAPFTQKMLWFDRESWLVDHALIRSDRASMAYGVEERVPLLDRALLDYVEPLPLSYKVGLLGTKRLLRDAFKAQVGTLAKEPKRGWFSPGTKWLRRGSLHTLAKEALSPSYYAGTKDLFAWDRVQRSFEAHAAGRGYALTPLWAILTFQLWAKAYSIELQ